MAVVGGTGRGLSVLPSDAGVSGFARDMVAIEESNLRREEVERENAPLNRLKDTFIKIEDRQRKRALEDMAFEQSAMQMEELKRKRQLQIAADNAAAMRGAKIKEAAFVINSETDPVRQNDLLKSLGHKDPDEIKKQVSYINEKAPGSLNNYNELVIGEWAGDYIKDTLERQKLEAQRQKSQREAKKQDIELKGKAIELDEQSTKYLKNKALANLASGKPVDEESLSLLTPTEKELATKQGLSSVEQVDLYNKERIEKIFENETKGKTEVEKIEMAAKTIIANEKTLVNPDATEEEKKQAALTNEFLKKKYDTKEDKGTLDKQKIQEAIKEVDKVDLDNVDVNSAEYVTMKRLLISSDVITSTKGPLDDKIYKLDGVEYSEGDEEFDQAIINFAKKLKKGKKVNIPEVDKTKEVDPKVPALSNVPAVDKGFNFGKLATPFSDIDK